jgi:hypothetical protein
MAEFTEDKNSSDYQQSINRELDRVWELLGTNGFSTDNVWVMRLFLKELRKALKVTSSVGVAVSSAISALVKQRDDYKAAHPTGADTWPPAAKLGSVRFGDPKEQIQVLLGGKKYKHTQEIRG